MLPKKLLKYNPQIFAKGKRGLIYTFKKNNKLYAVKIKNPESKAENRIQNEINFLKILNKYKIGPKIIEFNEGYFYYEFIEGKTLKEFLKVNKNPEKIFGEIIRQCKILDNLKINKEEMHKPLKNIIIKNNKVIMLDFERCHFTARPKNFNQFKQFLRRTDTNLLQ
ncbi:hypothetical protein HYU23_00205 [Candidatus Woesearchaeota archaeon]|nr:hypothetical protein [Candidatus Woesearchaeota archaeon]